MGRPLDGLRILVTRPVHQAERLCTLIKVAGGYPIVLPVLEIAEPRDPDAAVALIKQLADFDIALFISANAAERGWTLIAEHGGLPSHLRLAAVGRRTAEALEQHGTHVDIEAPPPYNSEALLATTDMQTVQGRRILIFRGEGGRELLGETLRQRGAEVVYVEVYRRTAPAGNIHHILSAPNSPHFIVITSSEGLRNLVEMAGAEHRDRLLDTPLVVISPRIAATAAEMGFRHPALVAQEANDEALIAAMAAGRSSRNYL